MSTVFSLFIFFLCVSMHACNGRHFGVINNASCQGCNKVKALEFYSSERGTKSDNGSAINTDQEAKENNSKVLSGSGRVSVLPVKNHAIANKPPGFFSDYSQPRTRREIFESSSHVGLLKAKSFLKASRRPAVELNNKKAEEDRVAAAVMDYEPPHQTPPIHNRHG